MKALVLVALIAFAPLAAADRADSMLTLEFMWEDLSASITECSSYMSQTADTGNPVMRPVERRLCVSLHQQSSDFITATRKHAARYPSKEAAETVRAAEKVERMLRRTDLRSLK